MELRRWQARIEVVERSDQGKPFQLVCLFGDTEDSLRAAIQAYLLKRELARFRNYGDHIVGRVTYFYSTELPPEENIYLGPLKNGLWWYQKESMVHGQIEDHMNPAPKHLGSFLNAVQHFLDYTLIPERGPDYQSRAIVGGNLRLPLLEKILRESEEHPLNDLILRGWHIVAVEYKGELSMTGELTNRKAVFVLGHPEAKAGLYTLRTEHYKNS